MIDARGQSCPIPVVMVQQEVKRSRPDSLQVQVDSMVCVENISRYAASQGFRFSYTEADGEYLITLQK